MQQSTVVLLDAATGDRLAVLPGGTGTRMRTAATSAVATDALARPGSRVLGLVVAGTAREVVEAADVLCTVTPAREPVVRGDWFHPGLHVNAVGAPPRPDHREIDSAGMARATVVADSAEVGLRKSGEVRYALRDGVAGEQHFRCELGDVLAGLAPGRTGPDQITLFNSVGLALQDLAFAALATGHPVPPHVPSRR